MPTADSPRTDGAAFAEHPTPLGTLTLAATGGALVYCAFGAPGEVRRRLAALPAGPASAAGPGGGTGRSDEAVLDEARAQLDAYLGGRLRGFSLPLDLRLATPFSRETVSALPGFVPYGTTGTYGALAEHLGRPRAARAVGTALGANPLCVVLPCHRIVGVSGRFTGYAGGAAAKEYLLGLEAGRPAAPAA
ncbi:methylated-DNA--[protein]-cysteine S-methyltransferase [Streptomyces sp. NPDC057011]|uniref:methylated-DNA--[protein]-cysteine S-methyltransferase n=1 Tax=unclassified Streptomyces TaxID=2593676 RepID=UPI00362DAEF0